MKYTIEFNERESQLIKELADKKGMSSENILKIAVRFYQTVELKLEQDATIQSKLEKLLRNNMPKLSPIELTVDNKNRNEPTNLACVGHACSSCSKGPIYCNCLG
jgi:hypothetical protein